MNKMETPVQSRERRQSGSEPAPWRHPSRRTRTHAQDAQGYSSDGDLLEDTETNKQMIPTGSDSEQFSLPKHTSNEHSTPSKQWPPKYPRTVSFNGTSNVTSPRASRALISGIIENNPNHHFMLNETPHFVTDRNSPRGSATDSEGNERGRARGFGANGRVRPTLRHRSASPQLNRKSIPAETNAAGGLQHGGNGEKVTETPVRPPRSSNTGAFIKELQTKLVNITASNNYAAGKPVVPTRQTTNKENKARSIGSDGNSDGPTPDSSLSSEESMSRLRSRPQTARSWTGSDFTTNPSNLARDILRRRGMEDPQFRANQSSAGSHGIPAREIHADLKIRMRNDQKEDFVKQIQGAEGLSTDKKMELIKERVESLESNVQELLQVNTALLRINRSLVQGMVDLTCLLADLDPNDLRDQQKNGHSSED